MSAKRVVYISDLHVGGKTALTLQPTNAVQEQVLQRYTETIDYFGKGPDALVVNGDALDGPYPDTSDVTEVELARQKWHAADLISQWNAKEIWMVSGTPRHTGQSQMWEKDIAAQLRRMGFTVNFRTKAKIEFCGWYKVECRHKISRSAVFHGRATAPLRAQGWNVIGAAMNSRNTGRVASWPHLCCYAHVHYGQHLWNAFGSVVTLPSWQAHGSRYPDETCDGHIDLGAYQELVPEEEGARVEWEMKVYPGGVVDRWDRR